MAEKNKKRGGRRAHLNDFHVNLAGDYVYTGAHYSYVDQGRSRDRVQRELLGLSVAIMLAVVAGGCSDAPAMLNCWYVILPYICEAAAAVSVIWAVLWALDFQLKATPKAQQASETIVVSSSSDDAEAGDLRHEAFAEQLRGFLRHNNNSKKRQVQVHVIPLPLCVMA